MIDDIEMDQAGTCQHSVHFVEQSGEVGGQYGQNDRELFYFIKIIKADPNETIITSPPISFENR